jgi:hypothetical protein
LIKGVKLGISIGQVMYGGMITENLFNCLQNWFKVGKLGISVE